MLEGEEEEKDILEELQDTVEDPSTPEVEEREEKNVIRNTRSGMTGSQLAQARTKDHKMSLVIIVAIVNHREDLKGKNLLDITLETLRRRREQEVLVQRDTTGEREVQTDKEIEETTTATEEIIEVDMTVETIALTDKKEENTHLTDKTEEITAQDTDKIDMKTEEETGGSIHLKKAEGILVTGEGDAKGP